MEKIKTEAFDTPTKGSRMLPFLIVKPALACDMLFQDKRITCKLSIIYIPIFTIVLASPYSLGSAGQPIPRLNPTSPCREARGAGAHPELFRSAQEHLSQ